MLIETTSCDVGVRVDLWCDSCDTAFHSHSQVPPDRGAVWDSATARGWNSRLVAGTVRHYCPPCSQVFGEVSGTGGPPPQRGPGTVVELR